MNALIIYDTLYGNTKQIAEAIAAGLSEQYQVRTMPVSEVESIGDDVDLLLIGGPTHRHGLSDGMRDFLERWTVKSLDGMPAAAFDTRYRGPSWLMGSAAKRIAQTLKRKHAHLVIPPESYFIARDQPAKGEKRNHETETLEAGEADRARAWGSQIASLVPAVA